MTRPALATAALLFALAPTPAAAWQRVDTVAELCAESGARPITRATVVRGQGPGGPIEAVRAPCTIIVTAGAVLRLTRVDVSLRGNGGRDKAALTILLRNGASLDLLRSRVDAAWTSIDGLPAGGDVRLDKTAISSTHTGARIRTAGSVTLSESGGAMLRGGAVQSVNGSVELLVGRVVGRNSIDLIGGPGGIRIDGGSVESGRGTEGLTARRGGSVVIVVGGGHSAARFTLEPGPALSGTIGAVVLVETQFPPAPTGDPAAPRVFWRLPAGAGCYIFGADPAEIACPGAGP